MFYFSKILGEAKLKTCFCTVIIHFGSKSLHISREINYPGPVSYFSKCPLYEYSHRDQAYGTCRSQKTQIQPNETRTTTKQTCLRISIYSKFFFRKFCRESKRKKPLYWVSTVQAIEFDAQATFTRKIIKRGEQIIILPCNTSKNTGFIETQRWYLKPVFSDVPVMYYCVNYPKMWSLKTTTIYLYFLSLCVRNLSRGQLRDYFLPYGVEKSYLVIFSWEIDQSIRSKMVLLTYWLPWDNWTLLVKAVTSFSRFKGRGVKLPSLNRGSVKECIIIF